jgi:hypothetical protein
MKGGEKSLKSDGNGGTRHERIFSLKEALARVWYETSCQCLVVRFEERAKECNKVARLTTIWEAEAKATCSQAMRSDVYKCVESLDCDPKPGDLDVGRLKRNESYVEDR